MFPVIRQSASPATAASKNGSSVGSGSLAGNGSPATLSHSVLICSSNARVCSELNWNFGLARTSPYSVRILASKHKRKLPDAIIRTISPGGPNGESSPATRMFVSTTTFTDGGLSVPPEFQRRYPRGRVCLHRLGPTAAAIFPQRPRLSHASRPRATLPDSLPKRRTESRSACRSM